MLYSFKIHEEQIGILDLPMSAYFNYFPTKKITIYAIIQHVPRLINELNTSLSNNCKSTSTTDSGLGFKYQINGGMGVELLYTD